MPAARFTLLFRLLLGLLLLPLAVQATHQRAAEITYRHVSGLTYQITLISYTFTPSPANAFRDFLTINWGDGEISDIRRDSISYMPNDITFNRYRGLHTFPGPSTYEISCEDPNRNGGILNIPNSINTPLFILSELTISPFIGGYNSSPVLLVPPVDNGCVQQPFYHNPGAYDADGDSLSYSLIPCRGALGQIIPGYTFPPATNSLTLDSVTGDLVWDSPPNQGEYNIAILIQEWRNGQRIGSVLRDMQIIIVACDNRPPVIDSVADTCVEAGKVLRMGIRAWDPDSNTVTLTGTGGPLIIPQNPATLNPNPATGKGSTRTTFRWSTTCNHIKRRPYQVFFKAKDDGSPVSLVTFKTLNITVVGPAPQLIDAQPLGNTITVTWSPYGCPNSTGFDLYRKTDSTGFVPSYCETGVPPYLGYSRIAQITTPGTTAYTDDNGGGGLIRGIRYCYLLVARFADKAESYASNEVCATLSKDVAVITNVSIRVTDDLRGSLYLAWSKPTEIDTLQAPGPYRYLIARARSDGGFQLADSLDGLNDTLWTDTLLNTRQFGFRYRIDLINNTPGNRFLIGSSHPASSMFLNITPGDQRLLLSWPHEVPWNNHRYDIFRRDPGSTTFDSIGSALLPLYKDPGLVNGEEYCYYIRSTGSYSSPGFVDPIINLSQVTCAIPRDNEPPCPPLLTVTPDCQHGIDSLIWNLPHDTCGRDIAVYHIYYSPSATTPLLLYDSVTNPYDTFYIYRPNTSVVGCFAVVAVDSAGNKSAQSNIVCIDVTDCPTYTLPNVFTPNGDGKNDYFRPKPYTSVSSINLHIFDRWGKPVFETHEPDINWDGKDQYTGQPCSDGTYFYVCDVDEITLTGTIRRTLKGSVTILR